MASDTLTRVASGTRDDASFRAIFDAAPYGMVLIDRAGTIRMANPRIEEKLGYTHDELIGRQIETLLPERYRAGHGAMRDAYFRNPAQRAMGSGRDLTGLRKDGKELPVEIGLSTIITPEGPMALAAIVNITERKRAERALHEANAQLEEFAYVSSHDLRSPIRGLGNLIEWTREDLAAGHIDKLDKNLERMKLRVERVENLIEDLLVYAHAGKRSARLEPIELNALVQEVLELETVPANMRVTLDIQVPPFTGARTPLATVLRNLLGNAIRHHDKPRGHIAIAAREMGNDCLITVTDDGPGIPEAARERVFRLFQTLTSSDRHRSGLGLAVAKRLVEGHGGSIELHAADGPSGCAFKVFWPRFIRSDLDD